MLTILRLITIAIFGLVLNVAIAQNMIKKARELGDFLPSTLLEITDAEPLEPGLLGHEDRVFVCCKQMLAKVSARLLGVSRPMPLSRKTALEQWANKFASNPEGYIQSYSTEFLFESEGLRYWIVVNENHIDRLKVKSAEGKPVELFIIRNFGIQGNQTVAWILLAENVNLSHNNY